MSDTIFRDRYKRGGHTVEVLAARAGVTLEVIPPSCVNSSVAIVYAEIDDTLLVTMTRILGLRWAYDYERAPALAPKRLAELTGRPRSTLSW